MNVLTGAGAERRLQLAQQCPSVSNLLECFVSWLRDSGSATSSFEGSAEVTAQTLFTVHLRFFFPPLLVPALAPAALSPA